MSIKNNDRKEKAIVLRKAGKTYSEILQEVSVAKSTLAIWLRDVNLSKKQKQRITDKRINSALKGAQVMHEKRLGKTKEIHAKAKESIGKISDRELFLIGVALYWAEGTKQKSYNVSARVDFTNSDTMMIQVFIKWLQLIKIPHQDISYNIYLHETSKTRNDEVRQYWSKALKLSITKFEKIYYKKNVIQSSRRNIGENYYGLVRVRVSKSTDLNRRIGGWIDGVCTN